MSLKIYNTQTRTKEEFTPLNEGQVKLYVCGPTVYDFLHVGNFRGAIFFNLVRNWLEVLGYNVTYVYNYTDVDDKIINRSNQEKVTSEEIAEKYIAEFEKDYQSLKLRPHSKNPRVTEHMDDIIHYISDLIEKKHAYVISTDLGSDVYYDVKSYKDYGKLSNKNIDDMLTGSRAEVNQDKHHAADFALWKSAKPGEPSWTSPWGKGRPGWHIECSVMSHCLLGDQIDIHGGGLDLVFPHHENEIAQSEGHSGKTFVKYWMHNNMLEFGNQKMSKSLGNIRTGRSFIEEFNGEILKIMMLSHHYRSIIDFSEDQIHRVIGSLAKFYSALNLAEQILSTGIEFSQTDIPKKFKQLMEGSESRFQEALNDDFNTPEVFALFYEYLKSFNALCALPGKVSAQKMAVADAFTRFIKEKGKIMALFQENAYEYLRVLDDMLLKKSGLNRSEVDQLVSQRIEARNNKNFEESDRLRDQLNEMGISVMDRPDGTVWEVQK
ncbi:MAG: cysteine--tRNA ligase [Bdellovibrionales bacterium]|nr:cysteine--tRNA ligase [Bdellovibrionales bacterium]